MKKLLTLFALFILLGVISISCIANLGQDKIKGKYNSETQIFETQDTSYWIDVFQDGVARISKGGYFGLIDTTGKILLEPKVDEILEIDENVIRYRKNGKLGCKERGEKRLFEPNHYIYPFYDGIARFVAYSDEDGFDNSYGKQGFVREDGFIITPIGKANGYSDFIDGIATMGNTLMNKEGKTKLFNSSKIGNKQRDNIKRTQGYVLLREEVDKKLKYYFGNSHFEKVSEMDFDDAYEFVKGYAVVRVDGSWGILNTKGEVLKTEFIHIKPVGNGTFIVTAENESMGVINHNGDILIPLDNTDINYLFNDLYAVSKLKQNTPPVSWYDGGYAVVNIENNEIIKDPSPNTYLKYYEELDIFKSSKSYPVDSIVNTKCASVTHYWEGICFCFKAHKVINKDPLSLKSGYQPHEYSGRIYYFDKNGLISPKGYPNVDEGIATISIIKDIISLNPPDYKHPYFFNEEPKLYKDKFKPVFRLVNGKLQIVEFNEFKGFFPLGHGKFIVANQNEDKKMKYGLVNFDKKRLIPLKYDELIYCEYNVLLARIGKKWGMISYAGRILAPFQYDYIEACNSGAVVRKNGKYGFIDLMGKETMPLSEHKIKCSNNMLYFEKDDTMYYIDKTGNPIN